MNRRPFARALLASAAIAIALTLGGCETDGTTARGAKATKPLSDKMIAELERRSMPKSSPILVRIFKEESELEVWKQDTNGQFALLKTYPICRWSGELGPKIKTGDRQAPEGFYTITPGQMNPNSSYYLSFNLGYPNAFDRAHGRTGAHLMVHGDCSSAGCYAMTDEQIQEIYALGRESFFGGQRSFQVQAYPFRMTPANMAKHRNNPHMAFWKMLKQGYDHFEVTRHEPKVDVCEKRYVFNATATQGSFNPAGACPHYEVPDEIQTAVNEKQRRDEIQTAQLISSGVRTAPTRMGTDGGMHPVFLAKFKPPQPTEDGGVRAYTPVQQPPGTIPAHAVPPNDPAPDVMTASASPGYRVASADSSAPQPASSSSSGNFFTRLLGGGSSSTPAPQPAAQPSRAPKPTVVRTANAAAAPGAIRPKPADAPAEPPQKANAGAIPPAPPSEPAPAAPPPAKTAFAPATSASAPSVLSGATPIRPTSSFDSRWSAFR